MNITTFFKKIVSELEKKNIQFALAGGLVASFYRKAPRATKDIDLLIIGEEDEQKTAEKLITSFGLKVSGPMFAIKKKSTPVFIVAGTGAEIGLDIILSAMPWADTAIERAIKNKINFGFGPIPSLTVEDLIISKLYALANQPTRFMDMDDLKSIFEFNHSLDLEYLYAQMKKLSLVIPEPLKVFAPKVLLRI